MVRLENEWALYLFGLLPLLVVLYIYFKKRRAKALSSFADPSAVEKLSSSLPVHKHGVKLILILLAASSAIIGIANPQIGSKMEEVKREGIDIIVALDLSRSMNATDTKPSRIDRAKQFISNYIDQLAGDRVGLVIFAGNAYLQMPITIDYSAAKLFLSTLNTDIVPTQGTAIGEAIRLASESFENAEANIEQNKAIIIISDGENHEGDAIDAAEDAAKQGIVVHTVGVGTSQGGPVPVYKYGKQYDFQRDKDNNIITSRLNQTMLSDVASKGNGKYFALNNANEVIKGLSAELDKLEKQEMETRIYSDYDDQFQYFFAAALFLLLIEMFVTERRNSWFKRINLFNN